ncbi:MAG: hypothetical protein NUW21_08860, partial [Elusimicrobia bacterium]|nr:hypothetical protein [Elusimicrobiota bacterium]
MPRLHRIALALLLLAAACSKKPAQNYRNCLKLRVGMTREQMIQMMGEPEETIPYVEGKSLPHLKGHTGYDWRTPGAAIAPGVRQSDPVWPLRWGSDFPSTYGIVSSGSPIIWII